MANEPVEIEYSVRMVPRYIVVRWARGNAGSDGVSRSAGGVSSKGEYDNLEIAHQVAYALCKEEQGRLGWPIDDDRIQYPKRQHPEPEPTSIDAPRAA